jgi:acetylornithine/N-succinyldiaminopimelate aminotransferase
MPIIPRPDAVMAHGSGSWLWDEEGRLYLDLLQGWAVNCLGHAPPVIAQAIAAQAQRLLTPCPLFLTRPHLELATRLADATGLDHAFFCNSGAEANEGAIKLARKWGQLHRNGAFRIITCTEAFHGRTLATMSASGKPGWDALFEPKVPGFIRVPFGDIAAIERAITDEVVAVMLEPIQGEAGVVPLPAADLRRLRELTRTKGVLLILDEIQTGVGRTGRFLACQHAGVQPDILTLGKGLGGGVPIAALLARQVVSCFEPGDQGGTFNGNPLVCAAANAVLATVLAPGFLERVATAGARLEAGLKGLCDRHQLAGIRGQGLLWAIDLGAPRSAAVVARARNLGLLINGPRPHLLRLMPALTISDVEIDQALGRLDAALDDWL